MSRRFQTQASSPALTFYGLALSGQDSFVHAGDAAVFLHYPTTSGCGTTYCGRGFGFGGGLGFRFSLTDFEDEAVARSAFPFLLSLFLLFLVTRTYSHVSSEDDVSKKLFFRTIQSSLIDRHAHAPLRVGRSCIIFHYNIFYSKYFMEIKI